MIVAYLEKIRDKFIKNRIEVNEALTIASNELKENIEFIKILEVSNDSNFESFTPRKVNSFNKTKISELKEEQKQIQLKIDKYREKLYSIEKEIDEVSTVINCAKKMKFEEF